MKLSMLADFKILKKNDAGDFVPMTNEQARSVSIGGFSFDVAGKSIPFDWDAFSGVENNSVFSFGTGRGWAFNDFELSDCYDQDYEDIGIKRENISAEFLSTTEHIEEFFVDFSDGNKEVGIGFYSDNANENEEYKLELVEISFEDMDTGKYFDVNPEVIRAFNKGIRREFENNLNNIKGDFSMNKLENWEIKGDFAHLTYSDNETVKVKKEDFDRAFGAIITASKEAVIRDFAIKDSLADKIKQAEAFNSKADSQNLSPAIERESR